MPNYYAIAAENSKTSPERFEEFCQIVRIRFRREFPPAQLLDPKRLAACYCVPEPVFDYFSVRATMLKLLSESTANVHLRTTLQKVDRKNDQFHVTTTGFSQPYDCLINASYSAINQVNEMVGAAQRTYRYEDCVIPVFRYDYAPFGLTVMDGPFCSVMPRGFRAGEFLLYHVKQSVLRSKLATENYDTLMDLNDDSPLFQASSEFMPFSRTVHPSSATGPYELPGKTTTMRGDQSSTTTFPITGVCCRARLRLAWTWQTIS